MSYLFVYIVYYDMIMLRRFYKVSLVCDVSFIIHDLNEIKIIDA